MICFFYIRRYIALTIIIPPSSRKRSKPPPLQSKGGFKEVNYNAPKSVRLVGEGSPLPKKQGWLPAMQKQKNQPCFNFILNSKVFCLLFSSKQKKTLCPQRVPVSKVFFAYFFSSQAEKPTLFKLLPLTQKFFCLLFLQKK